MEIGQLHRGHRLKAWYVNGHMKLKEGGDLLSTMGLKKSIRFSEDEGGEAGMKSFAKALAATIVPNSIIFDDSSWNEWLNPFLCVCVF